VFLSVLIEVSVKQISNILAFRDSLKNNKIKFPKLTLFDNSFSVMNYFLCEPLRFFVNLCVTAIPQSYSKNYHLVKIWHIKIIFCLPGKCYLKFYSFNIIRISRTPYEQGILFTLCTCRPPSNSVIKNIFTIS
jgi:hypothetical protein